MPALADLSVPSPALPDMEQAPAMAQDAALAPQPAEAEPLQTPFDAIANGKLPGLQVPPYTKEAGALDPIQDYVVSNLHLLQANGIEFTDLPDNTTVLYNPELVSTEEIAAAFKAGTLDKLVPTSASFQEFAAGQAAGAPAPGGLADVPLPTAAPNFAPAAAAGSTPAGVNRARLANVVPPGPGVKPNPIPNQLARRAL